MPQSPNPSELTHIGEAISKLIQQRYVWLFLHVARALFLNDIDLRRTDLPENYSFSKEDESAGRPSIPVQEIVAPIKTDAAPLGYWDEEHQTYDSSWLRTTTLVGIRGNLLLSVQSYLEIHRCEALVRKYDTPNAELFAFIRQARNVICHAGGVMNSPRLVRTTWRSLTIENNGQTLQMSDYRILDLLNDAIIALADLYIRNGRAVDPISEGLAVSLVLPRARD